MAVTIQRPRQYRERRPVFAMCGRSYFCPTNDVKGAMPRIYLRWLVLCTLLAALQGGPPTRWAAAQTAPMAAPNAPDAPIQISWEVRNRFRLFREERDFLVHTDSAGAGSILASEQALELQSDGRGWARNSVNRLCIDLTGRISEPCTRDGVKESYLTPVDHPITVRLTGQVPVGATCAWSFDDGDGPQQSTLDCAEPINLRVRYGPSTVATVDVSSGPQTPQRVTTEIAVRDLLIAGLGDSVASGRLRSRTMGFASAHISGPRPPNIIARAAPAIKADAPAKRRTFCRSGNARARSGSTRPAIARCTATRPAPRSRSPYNISISR
jgi:hypothetical protein